LIVRFCGCAGVSFEFIGFFFWGAVRLNPLFYVLFFILK